MNQKVKRFIDWVRVLCAGTVHAWGVFVAIWVFRVKVFCVFANRDVTCMTWFHVLCLAKSEDLDWVCQLRKEGGNWETISMRASLKV